MEINQKEWDLEASRLDEVCGKISTMLEEKIKSAEGYKEDVVEIRRSMWDNTAHVLSGEFDETVEILQYINLMKQEEKHHQHTTEQIKKLEKLLESPYFARIDFIYDEFDEKENIYIGMSSLIDNETMDIIIYDWRAPISSMYYEYELGEASYQVDKRTIKGTIDLKRQYKIVRSKLVYMFDSSIKIDDEILQEILSKNADDKMKNIVISIQKEQNQIIREEDARVLIVQGAAGSGKTSIALHRIAYLLYKHKDEGLNSKNVVIFSPNQIFNDYIGDVLPELGEENVHQTTFHEYARSFVRPEIQLENLNEQMDYMLSHNREGRQYQIRKRSIDYKSTREFLDILDKYLSYINDSFGSFEDVRFNKKTVVTKAELYKLYNEDYKHFAPRVRLKKIRDRIDFLLKPLTGIRLKEITKQVEEGEEQEFNVHQVSRARLQSELRELRILVDAMTEMDDFKLFLRLLEDVKLFERLAGRSMPQELIEMLHFTASSLRNGRMLYEDISPYIYFKGTLEGNFHIADIRHVVIDEAQDYSFLQYQIIKRLFNFASFTILGDVNQAINSYMHTADYNQAAEIFSGFGAKIMTLTKSYRSTREIWRLSEQVLESSSKATVSRSGEMPQIVELSSKEKLNRFVIDKLKELRDQNMKSIAVICKTKKQCEELFSIVKKEIQPVNLVVSDNCKLTSGISIIPCYLSKGLEFDGVVIYQASSSNYDNPELRKLMYTMCTRALHRLSITYTGQLTELLHGVTDEHAVFLKL